MKPKTFILNGKAGMIKDYESPGAVKMQFYNVELMAKALTELSKAGSMDTWELKQAKNVLKECAKPIVSKMKSLAPVSSRTESTTLHRHFSKGQSSIVERKHSRGELKRSIGVITKSRLYRKIPMIYVGVRTGTKYKNSGKHAIIAEKGRKALTAKPGKYFFFANKDGSVVKTAQVSGFEGRFFFKRAMDAERDRALTRAMDSFAFWFGNIWENANTKHALRVK